MGEFRDRMERDLQIRGLSSETQRCYLGRMKAFVRYFMRPPDELTLEDVHSYQQHLTRDRQVSWAIFNQTVAALRFFYGETLRKNWNIQRIPYHKTGRKLPVILSQDEVVKLFEATANIKHRALLMTAYGAGLRVSELVHLRVTDVDSQRMMLRVEQGKGRKDRYVGLSRRLLGVLRQYWILVPPKLWLFPGQDPARPLNRASVDKLVRKARKAAGITKKVSAHSLRHSYATHLLESGVNVRKIQLLLGHKSLRSTEVYTHVTREELDNTPSPLDLLPDLSDASSTTS